MGICCSRADSLAGVGIMEGRGVKRKERIRFNSADEYDAFTGWRRWYHWRAGRLKAIKRGYNRRVRKMWRDKLSTIPEVEKCPCCGGEIMTGETADCPYCERFICKNCLIENENGRIYERLCVDCTKSGWNNER